MNPYYDAELRIPTDLFNIVKSYYYSDNMYPFLEEVKEHCFYDLSSVPFEDGYRYDLSKENILLQKYFDIGERAQKLKVDKKTLPRNIYDRRKELLTFEAISFNWKLKELKEYADIDECLRYINVPMGDRWNWDNIDDYERDEYIFRLKPIII